MSTPITTRRIHSQAPIFLLEDGGAPVAYAPGSVAPLTAAEAERLQQVYGDAACGSASEFPLAGELLEHATRAEQRWLSLCEGEFAPTCLTVYLSNACNLGCGYCFAANPDGDRIQPSQQGLPVLPAEPALPRLDLARVQAAARLVAEHCQLQEKPFQLVLHGGGEPTLHWELMQQVIAETQAVAQQFGLEWSSYLATHGAIRPEQARWLGRHLQHVGVSCDGPAEIHDAQRPTRGGGSTHAQVAETIRILRDSPARLTLRATITRRALRRQTEIVYYFAEELKVEELRFEPMYHGDRSVESSLTRDDASAFAQHFLAAQAVADALGCRLTLSGVRLDEIHGPYCNVLRDVLQITPDGSASACFLVTDGRAPGGESMTIGRIDPTSGRFVIDQQRVGQMRAHACQIPQRCESCANIYHCARDCPDVCPVAEPDSPQADEPGFRCLVQKELGQRWILEAARPQPPPQRRSRRQLVEETREIADALRCLPADIDPSRIVEQWRLACAYAGLEERTMPEPPWSRGGFPEDSCQAWLALSERLAEPTSAPLSCYVHLPYCDRKCGFCDCYALLLPQRDDRRQTDYLETLITETEAWSTLGGLAQRPLSTVHFGGGTPTFAPPRDFARLLTALRGLLLDTPSTEWATETTSSELSEAYLDQLRDWGFTRLHVGVQSLDDTIRRMIGRREAADIVRDKLARALDRGFVVSVDLIYGLPQQTRRQFLDDIEVLTDLGLDGVALYHLNSSERNQTFAREYSPPVAHASYLTFQLGEALLQAKGFVKNHFAHFARPRDRNLYYTHVARGEDLLALGASADGSFGDYCYRHPSLGEYRARTTALAPALEGGLRETSAALRCRPLAAALMTGVAYPEAFASLQAGELLQRWLQFGMLEPIAGQRLLRLTANGSWFASRLLTELERVCGRD